METRFEGEDGHVWCTRGFVVHGGGNVFGGEVGVDAAALLLPLPHEGCFVGELVGVGTGLRGEDLVEAFGCDGQNASFEDVGPVVLGEVSQCGAVDDGGGHFGGGGGEEEGRVVVTYGDGGDLGVYVEEDVAVEVCDAGKCQLAFFPESMEDVLIAIALRVIGHHVQASSVENLAQSLDSLFTLRARDLSLYSRLSRLIWEEGMLAAVCNSGCCC